MTQANSNIEAANSQNDVDQAKTTGETSIDQVTPTVNKKATARNEITAILNNKLQEIQATPDATDEEKQAADAEANTENGKANQAISAATTNAQVDEAKANAEAAILNAVTPKVVKNKRLKMRLINYKQRKQMLSIMIRTLQMREKKQLFNN